MHDEMIRRLYIGGSMEDNRNDWIVSTEQTNQIDHSGVPTKEDIKVITKEFEGLKKAAVPVVVIEKEKVSKHAAKLKELGFSKLHGKVSEIADRAMKQNLIAMAGYLRIPAEKIKAAKATIAARSNYSRKLALLETSIEEYVGQNADEKNLTIPPIDVLEKLEIAKKSELFDSYSIIHVKAIPDPILLGRVKGVEDAFFIAEWGDDISLTDVMK